MAKKHESKTKVNLGVRVLPAVKRRLEEIASEISSNSRPATVTAAKLAEEAVAEYIERYERSQARAK